MKFFQASFVLREDNSHLWSNLVNNGLLESVTGVEDYESKTKNGLAMSGEYLDMNPVDVPSPADWLNVHYMAFMKVSPTAGEFRAPGHFVVVGGINGAESSRVIPELELLEAQTKEILATATTSTGKMSALVFNHARFEHIHPFADGNGRIGRLMLDAQIETVFGKKERLPLERDEYMAALKKAQREGDLTELTNLLAKREGLPISETPILSPFRMPPFLEDRRERSVGEDTERSRGFYTDKKPVFKESTQKDSTRKIFRW